MQKRLDRPRKASNSESLSTEGFIQHQHFYTGSSNGLLAAQSLPVVIAGNSSYTGFSLIHSEIDDKKVMQHFFDHLYGFRRHTSAVSKLREIETRLLDEYMDVDSVKEITT